MNYCISLVLFTDPACTSTCVDTRSLPAIKILARHYTLEETMSDMPQPVVSSGCIFCKILAGTIPARIAFRDEDVMAFHDIAPQAPTHVVIIPRQHISTIDDFTIENGRLLARMVFAAQSIADSVGAREHGYRLIINHGADGGQTVEHVHIHFLAGRNLEWPPG